MTKKELFDFLDKSLKGLPVEQKEKTIDRIIYNRYLQQYKKKITKGMKRCPLCGKYFPINAKVDVKIKEEKEEFTYTDGGYGDDDRTVTYDVLVEYHRCPRCKRFFKYKKM